MRKVLSLLALLLFIPSQVASARSDTPTPIPALSAQTDMRQVVFSAALIVGGYSGTDSDPAAILLRSVVQKNAEGIDPALRDKLQVFYRSHRREGVDETVDSLRYRALAVMVNDPPSFRFDVEAERVPEDVKPVVGFEELASRLYISPQFRKVLPQIVEGFDHTAAQVSSELAPAVTSIINYFRTQPLDIIEIPAIRDSAGKIVRPAVTRVRRLKVFVDPLLSGRAAAVRGDLFDGGAERDYQRIGDRYALFAGPTLGSDDGALRLSVIRFIVDPVVLKRRDDVDDLKKSIDALLLKNAAAAERYKDAPGVLVTDSLVSAANARLLVRAGRMSENGAIVHLGDARARGEVLALHLYERLKAFEQTGLNLETFFPDFAHSYSAEREATRDEEIAAAKAAFEREPKTPSAADAFAADILAADKFISEKRFDDARPILERVLRTSDGNARALFGLAQIIENVPDAIEKDPKSTDEDRINAQADRLETAVNLYRRAALGASSRELWLASWSHVYAGRILDFLELRSEAVAEYSAAVKIGDVARGAFKEAAAGVAAPYTP